MRMWDGSAWIQARVPRRSHERRGRPHHRCVVRCSAPAGFVPCPMPKRIQDLPEEYLVNQRSVARDIGLRVRIRRAALDLTQEHVRARMELERVVVSRTQFSRIEKGEAFPNAAEIIALRKTLGVSYTWLLEGKEEASRREGE